MGNEQAKSLARQTKNADQKQMTFRSPTSPSPHPDTMYCQKCRTPLKLDGSLESLNPAAFDLLVSKYLLFTHYWLLLTSQTLQAKRYPTELHPPSPHIHPTDVDTTIKRPEMLRRQFIGGRFPPLAGPRSLEAIAATCHSSC
jgi:hypothetical protein